MFFFLAEIDRDSFAKHSKSECLSHKFGICSRGRHQKRYAATLYYFFTSLRQPERVKWANAEKWWFELLQTASFWLFVEVVMGPSDILTSHVLFLRELWFKVCIHGEKKVSKPTRTSICKKRRITKYLQFCSFPSFLFVMCLNQQNIFTFDYKLHTSHSIYTTDGISSPFDGNKNSFSLSFVTQALRSWKPTHQWIFVDIFRCSWNPRINVKWNLGQFSPPALPTAFGMQSDVWM